MASKIKKLVLPRLDKDGNHYISYSQLNTWKRSKREYMRQYFWGEGFDGNAYTDFGTLVGEALENGDFSEFTAKEKKFLETIPRYGEYEREIRLEMKGFYVKGFIDTSSKPQMYTKAVKIKKGEKPILTWVDKIADYKTGDVVKKKAEYESESYIQVDLYAAAMRQQFGVLPDYACVYLINRTGNAFQGEDLVLGDKFIKIDKPITNEKADQVLEEVQMLAEEISAYYQVFLKLKS
jgi:hypothetical protein